LRDTRQSREYSDSSSQVIYCIGWAPHHSQPKPKQRGSAEYSLKDLGKLAGKPVETLLELDDDEEEDKKEKK
jgi:hypothetical protein